MVANEVEMSNQKQRYKTWVVNFNLVTVTMINLFPYFTRMAYIPYHCAKLTTTPNSAHGIKS